MYTSRENAKALCVSELRGGQGETIFHTFFDQASCPRHSRLITEIVVNPGCSIGRHTHTEEAEIYYVVEGSGVLDDNGEKIPFHQGDCHYCHQGNYHGIVNNTQEPMKLFAVVVTESSGAS